jgi:nucleotide-binding universal stress UspA family protein
VTPVASRWGLGPIVCVTVVCEGETRAIEGLWRVRGTLVCAVNEVGAGLEALEVAGELSDRLGLRLVLLFVTETGADPAAIASEERTARLLLACLAAEQGGRAGGIEFREAAGDSAVHLGWVVAEEAADVIVVGSTRRRWLRRGFECRLAERLACETQVPIVIALPRSRRQRRRGRLETTASR